MVALDASALIALLLRESGHERVAERLGEACISSVNLVEVFFRLMKSGFDPKDISRWIAWLGIETVALEPQDAPQIADLIARTRSAGLSLGDCACLRLAIARGIPALTADRAWSKIEVGVDVELIR